MTNKPEFFWNPPDGSPIVGMVTYQDVIVVATGSGVYTICSNSRTLDSWEVRKLSHDNLWKPQHEWTDEEVRRVVAEQEAGLVRQAKAKGV